MIIGEKVWFPSKKKIGVVIDIKNEWTDYPHGSGTNYEIIKFNVESEIITIDTMWNTIDYWTLKRFENENSYLRNKIKEIEENIENNIKIMSLFK